MDYTEVPRSLIYKKRTNLDDFGVRENDSLNGRLFNLMSEYFLSIDDAKDLILQCFNNAYYLCTLILLEDFPNLCVDKYEKELLDMNVRWKEDTCAASFALAYEMLQVYDQKWQKNCLLLKAMHKRFNSGYWRSVYAANSFNELIDKVDKSGTKLSRNEFAPRDITEAIKNVSVNVLVGGKEYIIEKLTHDDSICINKELESITWRIKKDLDEIYEDWAYDPKTGTFEGIDPQSEPDYNTIEDVQNEIDRKNKAMEYFNKSIQIDTKDIEGLTSSMPATIREMSFNPLSGAIQQAEKKNDDNMDKSIDHDISKYKAQIQELQDENKRLKNRKIYIDSDKELERELDRIKVLHEDTLVALLKPAFYNIENDARDFLKKIQGLDNQGVTDVAWQFLQDKKITPNKKGRGIWEILKAAKLYSATEQNWTAALRKYN